MGFKFLQAGGLLPLLLIASMLAVCMANKDWQSGFNSTDWFSRFGHHNPNQTQTSNKIIVGGSEKWHFGYNYTEWAIKNGPFYLNDTLVFKYDPPLNNSHPHSVYLFSNFWSFLNCDLKRAKMVANITQGDGNGFEFVLKRWQPHYFACGESNGIHCKLGQMKFFVMPMLRRWYP